MLPHRTAANMLRKRLRALVDFAIRQGIATTNPVVATKPYGVDSTGFHTRSEDEIARYEARHPVGTKARLALDLMLWAGQRGGDARLMCPQHVQNKRLEVSRKRPARSCHCRSCQDSLSRSWPPRLAPWSSCSASTGSPTPAKASATSSANGAMKLAFLSAPPTGFAGSSTALRGSRVQQSTDQGLDWSHDRQRGCPLHRRRRSARDGARRGRDADG